MAHKIEEDVALAANELTKLLPEDLKVLLQVPDPSWRWDQADDAKNKKKKIKVFILFDFDRTTFERKSIYSFRSESASRDKFNSFPFKTKGTKALDLMAEASINFSNSAGESDFPLDPK